MNENIGYGGTGDIQRYQIFLAASYSGKELRIVAVNGSGLRTVNREIYGGCNGRDNDRRRHISIKEEGLTRRNNLLLESAG